MHPKASSPKRSSDGAPSWEIGPGKSPSGPTIEVGSQYQNPDTHPSHLRNRPDRASIPKRGAVSFEGIRLIIEEGGNRHCSEKCAVMLPAKGR